MLSNLPNANLQTPPAPIRLVFWFVVLTLLGIWPALTNGQPFFFADTTAYIRGADLAIAKAFGNRFATEWAKDQRRSIGIQTSVTDTRQSASEQDPAQRTVLAGRSIIYGALLYMGALTGGMWISIIVQSLVAVYLLYLFVVRTLRLDFRHFLVSYGVLLLASTLPFYVSELMPDVFAGLLILGFAILAGGWERLSNAELAITSGVILFATLSHTTHVLLLIALTTLTGAFAVLIQRSGWRRIRGLVGVAAVCVLLSFLCEAAFSYGVTRALGAPPVRPPILSAKLVSILGAPAVSRVCASNDFAVCRFQDRFPIDMERFMWSEDKASGVFSIVDAPTKRALGNEQVRFALAIVPQNPGRFVSGILHDALLQLTVFGLGEYCYNGPQGLTFFESRLPARDFERMTSTLAARSRGYVVFGRTVVYGAALLSAVLVALLLGGALNPPDVGAENELQRRTWRAVTSILLGGVVLNAIICGGLSQVNNRYEARVIWLLPLSLITGIYAMRPYWKADSVFKRNLEKQIAVPELLPKEKGVQDHLG